MVVQTRSRTRLSRESSPAQASQGLPEPSSLPLHKYRPAGEHGNGLSDLTYSSRRQDPRNCDFVVDPADWTAGQRGRNPIWLQKNNAGAPQGANTVETILGANIAEYLCEVCDEYGDDCYGKECIAIYKNFLAGSETTYLEIRDAGNMGKGVFAKQDIKKGTTLCEYTGRLRPLDPITFPRDVSYTWEVDGSCNVDATVYGNIARFVNHHCTQYNCEPLHIMYGRRKVLRYDASQDISKDEQLYVSYGSKYFGKSKPCLCSAAKGPHLLDKTGRANLLPKHA